MKGLKIAIIILSISALSCKNDSIHVDELKNGTFETELEEDAGNSVAIRNDSIQIELFDGKRDTFYIRWKNDFEYTLLKKNPKNLLDSTPFHVKITAIKKNTYNFTAHYKGSNFKQKGTATKVENQ